MELSDTKLAEDSDYKKKLFDLLPHLTSVDNTGREGEIMDTTLNDEDGELDGDEEGVCLT